MYQEKEMDVDLAMNPNTINPRAAVPLQTMESKDKTVDLLFAGIFSLIKAFLVGIIIPLPMK